MRARRRMPRALRRNAARRDERGAVALTVGAMSLLLVVVASFVVDLGMQRIARQDMQALADLVALDLVHELDGRSTSQLATSTPTLQTLAEQSRDRNGDTMGSTPRVSYRLGEIGATGRFVASTSPAAQPTAVEVTVTTTVDFAFQNGSGAATRSATSAVSSFACYKIGSWAALVDTNRSVLLDPLLRQMAQQTGAFSNGASVGALTYSGLAQADVDLNGLAAELGVASLDQLATTSVSLKRLFVAVSALAQPRNATIVSALNTLALTASATRTVQLGKLLQADAGSASLLGATANVLDLVGGSIALLNGTNAANVYLGATLPSLSSAGLEVRLTQGPHQYCGRPGSTSTTGVAADTEQLRVRVGGQLAPTTVAFVPPAIAGLLSSVTSASIVAENYATFDVSVAGTSSRLKSVTCGATQEARFDVVNGLATLTISTPLRAEVRAKLLGGSGLVDAVIRINAGVTVRATIGESGVTDLAVTVPPQSFDTPYPTSSGGVTLTSVTRSYGNVSANVSILGGLLGANINLSTAQQNQLLDSILGAGMSALLSPTDPHSLSATVLDPVLALIGARVGGSDVIVDSVPALECQRPRLVG